MLRAYVGNFACTLFLGYTLILSTRQYLDYYMLLQRKIFYPIVKDFCRETLRKRIIDFSHYGKLLIFIDKLLLVCKLKTKEIKKEKEHTYTHERTHALPQQTNIMYDKVTRYTPCQTNMSQYILNHVYNDYQFLFSRISNNRLKA